MTSADVTVTLAADYSARFDARRSPAVGRDFSGCAMARYRCCAAFEPPLMIISRDSARPPRWPPAARRPSAPYDCRARYASADGVNALLPLVSGAPRVEAAHLSQVSRLIARDRCLGGSVISRYADMPPSQRRFISLRRYSRLRDYWA